jgi:hypothetical protein
MDWGTVIWIICSIFGAALITGGILYGGRPVLPGHF